MKTIKSIEGQITLSDGTITTFTFNENGVWQQQNSQDKNLDLTVQLLNSITNSISKIQEI